MPLLSSHQESNPNNRPQKKGCTILPKLHTRCLHPYSICNISIVAYFPKICKPKKRKISYNFYKYYPYFYTKCYKFRHFLIFSQFLCQPQLWDYIPLRGNTPLCSPFSSTLRINAKIPTGQSLRGDVLYSARPSSQDFNSARPSSFMENSRFSSISLSS